MDAIEAEFNIRFPVFRLDKSLSRLEVGRSDAGGEVADFKRSRITSSGVRWADIGAGSKEWDFPVRVGLFDIDDEAWRRRGSIKDCLARAVLVGIDGVQGPSNETSHEAYTYFQDMVPFAFKLIHGDGGYRLVIPVAEPFPMQMFRVRHGAGYRGWIENIQSDMADTIFKDRHEGAAVDKRAMRGLPWVGYPGSLSARKVGGGARASLVGNGGGGLAPDLCRLFSALGFPAEGDIGDALAAQSARAKIRIRNWGIIGQYPGASKELVEQCGFVRAVDRDPASAPMDWWRTALQVLAARGDAARAQEWASARREAGEALGEEAIFNPSAKKYVPLCSKVAELGSGHCQACPLSEVQGMSPASITGPLPTPGIDVNFWKYGPGGVRTNVVNGFGYANAFLNLHGHKLFKVRHRKRYAIFMWVGTHYVRVTDDAGSPGSYSREFLKIIREVTLSGWGSARSLDDIVKNLVQSPGLREKSMESMAPDPRYISFRDGVFDVEKGRLMPHSPDYFTRTLNECNFSGGAASKAAKKADDAVAAIIPDVKDRELFRGFAGLSLTSIPTQVYGQFLWIHGRPGIGKSTLMALLRRGTAAGQIGVGVHAVKAEGGYGTDFQSTLLHLIDDFNPNDARRGIAALRTFIHDLTSAVVATRRMQVDMTDSQSVATVVLASNHPEPRVGPEDPLHRRVRSIMLASRLPEERISEIQKFVTSSSGEADAGILKWKIGCLLECLHRFKTTGKHLPPLTEDEKVSISHEQSLAYGVQSFLEEYCEMNPSRHTPVKDILALFTEVMGKRRGAASSSLVSAAQFNQTMAVYRRCNRAQLIINTSVGGKMVRCYRGIALKKKEGDA